MKNEYKLTSITFSDENDDQVNCYAIMLCVYLIGLYTVVFLLYVFHNIWFLQDFELWDDVGLNIPKPPDLLQLYRNCGNSLPLHRDTADVAVSVDPSDLPGDYFTQEPVQQTEVIQVVLQRGVHSSNTEVILKCWKKSSLSPLLQPTQIEGNLHNVRLWRTNIFFFDPQTL